MTAPDELRPGLWRWATPHPEWSSGAFGAEVASFALVAGEDLLLVDPLLPADAAAVLARLDALARGRRVHVLVTLGDHARSADDLADHLDAGVHGPPQLARRLRDPARLQELVPGVPGPGGATAFAIGSPVRGERPLWLPSHRAVAFGDAVVATPERELRMWEQEPVDRRRQAFYARRFAPTLAPLAALEPEHVLVTHGAAVVGGGAAALRTALEAPPWYHRG
ncbi:MAG: fold metallo-hydrolase [Solirubrobacterales bacterium]|nr:fold metallo-hydrolase [Solirubrobacterales bacterium]